MDVPQNFKHKDFLADETGGISTLLHPTEPLEDRLCTARLVGECKKKQINKITPIGNTVELSPFLYKIQRSGAVQGHRSP